MLHIVWIIVYFVLFFSDKQEDDEVVLQIVYFFSKMISHDATRSIIIKQTRILYRQLNNS